MRDETCFNQRDRMDMAVDRISFLQEIIAAADARSLMLSDRGLAGLNQILEDLRELLEVRGVARAA